MANRSAAAGAGKLPEKLIRQQLERVLASTTFHQVDRLKRFLKFIALEAIAGRSGELKEYVIGVQVFGKEPSFDPRTDPIVRVQARRLRARLERFYREEGQQDHIVFELPKGGYAPVFKRRETSASPKRSIHSAFVSRNTVAVMPFADHSVNGDLEYFCRGIRHEIIHHLTAFKTVRVLAWRSAETSEAAPQESPADAALIVGGSVRSAGDRIRVTTQLVDGTSGYYLWSHSVDAPVGDTFGAQERVAKAIVEKLEPELADAGQRPQSSENLAARNLYLQGRYHLNQRTEEGLHKAAEFFEKALVEDAQFALAHSGLTDAYSLLNHYGVLGPADVWAKAASSAASAVMLDGASAEAHTSLAHVKATQDWDFPGAEREFQRAIGLNPRYATAHHWYAMSCLVPLGRLDEALEQITIAQSLDPVSSIIAREGAVIQFYRRDFDAALDHCDQTIELNPHFAPAYMTLGFIQEHRREFDEAAAAFRRAVDLSPQSPRMQAALARTHALSGKPEQAITILQALERTAEKRYVSAVDFAMIHFGLGDRNRGFKWLTRACDDRSFDLLALRVDPRFDPLRDDNRFAAVAQRVGLGPELT